MAKRRTRKEKQQARRTNLIMWEPELSNPGSKEAVKMETSSTALSNNLQPNFKKSPDNMSLSINPSTIKKDVLKSLALAFIIISFEIVLYLTWK